MTLSPYDLRVDAGGDQFPVTGPEPRLSWKGAGAGRPDAHELECRVDGGEAVRVVTGPGHRLVPWPWRPLRSCERVLWRVRETRSGAAGSWSEWASFEAGLYEPDWSAQWICPAEQPGQPGARPAHLLTSRLSVPAGVESARLYATALGLYELTVNGKRVGAAELSPGPSSYDRTLYAQAFDVTDLLVPGENQVEILLADGWYKGLVGAFRIPADWGDTLAARAELVVTGTDGSVHRWGTDGTWLCGRSQVLRADLMAGETVDQRVTCAAETPVRAGQVTAPPVSWSPAPPVRVVETRPATVTAVRDGVWVADFGQNASGWVRLPDVGRAGARTVIDFGEHLGADGDLSLDHLASQQPGQALLPFVQRDEVVSAGTGEPFEPRHTVHGFQYARVASDDPALDLSGITMQVVQTDMEPAGTFACSDADLTRLYDVARWSFRGNAVGVPTDCPTRERLGWTGDYQVFVSTAVRLYDVLGFSRAWLQSVVDDQLDDGRIANFSPDGRQVKHHLDDRLALMTGSAGWGDAIAEVPWQLYLAYGDSQVLADCWPAMVRWVEWALGVARTARHPSRVARSAEPLPHEAYLWDGSFHWGEWCEPKVRAEDGTLVDPFLSNPAAWFMADKGEVGTAYLYRSSATVAAIAEVLGYEAEAARYRGVADLVLDAWRAEFLSEDGRVRSDTQAGYVRALSFGLVPDALRAAAADRLVGLVRAAGDHLTTGFLSTADLLPVLAETGHADVAYAVLGQRTSPSWLAMLDRGATTVWEDWEGVDEHGVAHDSLNHYSKGAVARFLHSHVLGLRPDERSVAWESFVVEPVLGGGLTWARGTLVCPQGEIGVSWEVGGADLVVTVDVPPGCRARVVLPDGRSEDLVPGRSVVTGRA